MCNLSKGVEEKGIAIGLRKGIENTIDILLDMEISKKEIEKIISQKYNILQEQVEDIMLSLNK